ncbi:MAG: hypothetical protein R2712_01575 [Vicinamibacterales bacterium]
MGTLPARQDTFPAVEHQLPLQQAIGRERVADAMRIEAVEQVLHPIGLTGARWSMRRVHERQVTELEARGDAECGEPAAQSRDGAGADASGAREGGALHRQPRGHQRGQRQQVARIRAWTSAADDASVAVTAAHIRCDQRR